MRQTLLRLTVCLCVLLAMPLAHEAAAQDRPGPAAEFAAGWVGFADDDIVSETLIGGAARVYLLPRVSIGPELGYIGGENHSHLVLTANVTWDILAPVNGRPARVTPFIVVGAGMFRTHETFFDDAVTSSEGAFTAGGGVRGFVGDRVFVGVDVRVGWEAHVRLNAVVGVQFGR